MRVYHVVLFFVLAGVALPVWLHQRAHGFDADQAGLAFFLWLNTIIAFWEICLFLRIRQIENEHVRFVPEYKGRELARAIDFFNKPIALGQIFSPSVWAELWSSYSVFDESYANRKSFGFFIDVGNGFSTFLPCLIGIYGMTFPLLPARAFGLMLLIVNYQMWYGTVIYAFSYVFNRRYVGHKPSNVALFVGFTNGLWFIFPLWAMYAAVTMIYSDSYAIFRP